MKIIEVFCFYIFLILTVLEICKGSNKHLIITSSVGSRLLDLLKSFNEDIYDPNTAIIAGYSGIIKERNDQIAKLNIMISEREKLISYFQYEVDECVSTVYSCLQSNNTTHTYKIYAPGMNESFDVLCNSQIDGSGWMVIKQNIVRNFLGDFNRTWTDYRNGFGSLDGNFFLGLEKIHRLTRFYPHEMYIYIEKDGAESRYAYYERFEIAGEGDQYRLNILGNYTGNVKEDPMRHLEHTKFYTFDNDSESGCPKAVQMGWWFNNDKWTCFLTEEVGFGNGAFAGYSFRVEKFVMLIRP